MDTYIFILCMPFFKNDICKLESILIRVNTYLVGIAVLLYVKSVNFNLTGRQLD